MRKAGYPLVLIRLSLLSFLVICLANFSLAQRSGPPNNPTEYEEKYQKRIKKDYLAGIYIPQDLADAFIQLNRLTDADGRRKFLSLPEEQAARKLFFSFGRWMIVNWSFYEGSRFSHYLKGLGISHPEDMARFVMISYHRNLRKQPLQVKALIEQIVESRKKAWRDRVTEGELLEESSRQLDSTNQIKKG